MGISSSSQNCVALPSYTEAAPPPKYEEISLPEQHQTRPAETVNGQSITDSSGTDTGDDTDMLIVWLSLLLCSTHSLLLSNDLCLYM